MKQNILKTLISNNLLLKIKMKQKNVYSPYPLLKFRYICSIYLTFEKDKLNKFLFFFIFFKKIFLFEFLFGVLSFLKGFLICLLRSLSISQIINLI